MTVGAVPERDGSPPRGTTTLAASPPASPLAVPSIRRALRDALTDFYFNSWRLAPANVAWAAVFVGVLLAGARAPMAFPLLLAVLAVPYTGIQRMAALIARGEAVALSDFVTGMRRFGGAAAAIGFAVGLITIVLVTNLLVGLESGTPIGWFTGATAGYGLLALGLYLVALWPILVDPRRESVSLRRRIALPGAVLLARPLRSLALSSLLIVLLAVSVVLFAAIVLVSVSYASLVACRVVLPAADEVEARLKR